VRQNHRATSEDAVIIGPNGRAQLPGKLRDALCHIGLDPPRNWHGLRVSSGPSSVQLEIADEGTKRLVTAELCPPWHVTTTPRDLMVEGTLFAWRPGGEVGQLPLETTEVTTGERRFKRGRYKWISVFKLDTGTVVAWDPRTCTAALALTGRSSEAELDAREVLHRQLMQRFMQRRGLVLLHGAGIAVQDKAVVIIGDSGAGKTTLQLDLALINGGQLLGGGRVYVTASGQVFPYPGRFTIGKGLAANRNAFRPLLRAETTMVEAEGNKLAVRSLEVARVTSTTLGSSGQLALFVFPHLIDGQRMRLGPVVSSGDASCMLCQQCLVPDDRWPPWLGSCPDADRQTSLAVLDDLANRFPAVQVGVPVDATQPDGATLRLMIERWLM
jgi:hypothetical protein